MVSIDKSSEELQNHSGLTQGQDVDQSHVRYDKSPPFQGTIGVNDTMNQNSENNYTMDANKTKELD